MNFVCPVCQGTRLEEVMPDVTVSSTIVAVHAGGDVEYGAQSDEDGNLPHYQCMDCGGVLVDAENAVITDSEELYNWLSQRGMLEPGEK